MPHSLHILRLSSHCLMHCHLLCHTSDLQWVYNCARVERIDGKNKEDYVLNICLKKHYCSVSISCRGLLPPSHLTNCEVLLLAWRWIILWCSDGWLHVVLFMDSNTGEKFLLACLPVAFVALARSQNHLQSAVKRLGVSVAASQPMYDVCKLFVLSFLKWSHGNGAGFCSTWFLEGREEFGTNWKGG